ncbi:hypothetical protein D3C77_536070 [compost metagenome]
MKIQRIQPVIIAPRLYLFEPLFYRKQWVLGMEGPSEFKLYPLEQLLVILNMAIFQKAIILGRCVAQQFATVLLRVVNTKCTGRGKD